MIHSLKIYIYFLFFFAFRLDHTLKIQMTMKFLKYDLRNNSVEIRWNSDTVLFVSVLHKM
jgi:hypothetical protein